MLPLTTDLVTILARRVTVDPNTGNDVESWTAVETLRGSVQPLSANETPTAFRDSLTTLYAVYLPPRANVTAVDRLEWGDLVLEVMGDPKVWPRVAGVGGHVELTARIAKG